MLHVFDLELVPSAILSSLIELTGLQKRSAAGSLAGVCTVVRGQQWLAHMLSIGAMLTPGIPHGARANKKMFAAQVLRSEGYPHVSQKLLKGIAARTMSYWLCPLVYKAALEAETPHAKCLASRLFVRKRARHRANVFLAITTLYTLVTENGRLGCLCLCP